MWARRWRRAASQRWRRQGWKAQLGLGCGGLLAGGIAIFWIGYFLLPGDNHVAAVIPVAIYVGVVRLIGDVLKWRRRSRLYKRLEAERAATRRPVT